jgi:hypothetical protein
MLRHPFHQRIGDILAVSYGDEISQYGECICKYMAISPRICGRSIKVRWIKDYFDPIGFEA